MRGRLVRVTRWVALAFAIVFGALLTVATGDALYSSTLPALRPWHTARLQHEFVASQAGRDYTFDDYRAQEARLFDEVRALSDAHFDATLDTAASRYAPGRGPYAARVEGDWNRSYLLPASPQRGVALLVHGLSDSPYSLRALALALRDAGVTVYGLRLPGHGTIPAGLDHALWEDWLAAVQVAVRQIRRDHPDAPFWYVGYSTGATLGIRYSIDAIEAGQPELLPRRMFVLSPAMGVSPFARLANVQRLISRWGVAPKARWGNVGFEIDPYKYDSFAKNAGAQIAALIRTVDDGLARLQRNGLIERFPPVTGFQSAVDATVSVPDLVARFYSLLRGGSSELVLFDLNRHAGLEALLTFSPKALTESIERAPRHEYRLTVLRNAAGTPSLVERSWAPGGTEPRERPLEFVWPPQVFSLSHVALPFPPDDPIYGLAAPPAADGMQSLGALALRGEHGALAISPGDQLRLKSNPFFAYVRERVLGAIGEGGAASR